MFYNRNSNDETDENNFAFSISLLCISYLYDILTWLLYLRYLVLPALLVWLVKAVLWPRYVRARPDPCSSLPIPPGDVGWPLIGETLDFIIDVSAPPNIFRGTEDFFNCSIQ